MKVLAVPQHQARGALPGDALHDVDEGRSHPPWHAQDGREARGDGAPPLYFENIEGGHRGAADIKQAAYVESPVYTFLGPCRPELTGPG